MAKLEAKREIQKHLIMFLKTDKYYLDEFIHRLTCHRKFFSISLKSK